MSSLSRRSFLATLTGAALAPAAIGRALQAPPSPPPAPVLVRTTGACEYRGGIGIEGSLFVGGIVYLKQVKTRYGAPSATWVRMRYNLGAQRWETLS